MNFLEILQKNGTVWNLKWNGHLPLLAFGMCEMSCQMIHYGCYILTLDSCHHVTMITWPNHHWIPLVPWVSCDFSNSTEWWRSTNHVIEIKNRIIDNYDKDLFNWTEAKDRKNIFGAAKSQTQYLAQPKTFFT